MKKLTQKEFVNISNGSVFAKGTIKNSPEGIYMTDSNRGELLKWVAVKGYGNDWCIYCYWDTASYEYVERSGDKVNRHEHILRLVDADDEVMKLYRH